MNFATLAYAGFLAIVIVAYWLLPRSGRRPFLVVASLVFYGTWNWLYVPGFVALVLANWGLGLLAARPGFGRRAIVLAVAVDLGILGLFKYADWVLGAGANVVVRLTGDAAGFGAIGLVLPLAISFVTFTLLAYVVDTARGARPERDLVRFALFVTFFPHLIAGPIMRGREFLPQVRHLRPFAIENVRFALPLLVGGFLKKILGDTLAPAANTTFAAPGDFSTPALWVGVLAFTFQILLDFSGYTDIALGSAALLGFRLPRNFEWPYRASSIQEFWRRWHMTLSRWLRDYLYIALGGSRHGPRRTYLAMMATMLLGGLWHGAGLQFVVWGAWHGAGLAVHRWYRTHLFDRLPIPTFVGWAATFLFVVIGWVFFRAASLEDALVYLRGMFVPVHGEQTLALALAGGLAVVFVVGQWPRWRDVLRTVAPEASHRRYLAYGLALLAGVMLVPIATTPFIYFQF